ncbi:uncharacterized protein LOC125653270 [Ostrea edulis]|uniref:uncharacterized protein LOC125653270 n=1 Tax=Ostrea edulis TaxID=37623 RepID=UPI002095E942|nr:uncharacterized protein LOC125653270 [Ostrea edulis]
MAWIALVFGLVIAVGVCVICISVFFCMKCSSNIGLEERANRNASINTSQSAIAFLTSTSHKTFLFDDSHIPISAPVSRDSDDSDDMSEKEDSGHYISDNEGRNAHSTGDDAV